MIKFHYSTIGWTGENPGGWLMEPSVILGRQESYGYWVTKTAIPDNSGQNLFINITDTDNFNEVAYYKNFFLYYDSSGFYSGATGIKVWIENLPSGVDFSIGFDPIGATVKTLTGNQSTGVPYLGGAPEEVEFSVPTSSSPLTMPTLNEGYVKCLWLKLQANAIASQELDKRDWVDVFVEYDNF